MKDRESLFAYLDTHIEVSDKKFHVKNKSDMMRLKWSKNLGSLISIYGKLLETQEIEDLIVDVQKIKEKLNIE